MSETFSPSTDNQPQVESSNLENQLDRLSTQLAQIQQQLTQLQNLPEQVTQIQQQLLRVADVYRYEKLQSFLAAGKWSEADTETIHLIITLSEQPELELIRPEDIQHIACSELQVIDRLWSKYSDGRFGFSVQVKFYQEMGGSLESTIEQDNKLIQKWGERLGWRKDGRWLKCRDLDYSLNAPEGCHPSRWWNSPYGSKMTNYFLARLINCELSAIDKIDRGKLI
ncbi:MAG: GUN4 domain-containing protein [Xenococcaceae cyanobacterium MO_188.B32]|nr:GUN4 domain-containing protein [Xenococcaceae cyanobacterium MO_188.B32]